MAIRHLFLKSTVCWVFSKRWQTVNFGKNSHRAHVSRNYRLLGVFENSCQTVISSGRCLPGGTIPAM